MKTLKNNIVSLLLLSLLPGISQASLFEPGGDMEKGAHHSSGRHDHNYLNKESHGRSFAWCDNEFFGNTSHVNTGAGYGNLRIDFDTTPSLLSNFTWTFDPSVNITDISFHTSNISGLTPFQLLFAENTISLDFSSGAHGYLELAVVSSPAAVPAPGAVWLFGSGLAGLIGIASRRSRT